MSSGTANPPQNIYYATFLQRLIAHCLDRIIILAALVLIGLWSGFYYSEIDPKAGSEIAGLFCLSQILCFQAPLLLFIFTAMKGTTPGKRLLRLYVIKWDGTRANALTILLRETFAKAISACVWGYLWALFDDYDRAAHDRIMQTQVIYVERAKRGEKND